MERDHKIMVVGIGNTIRGDDGMGAYISSSLENLRLGGVKTIITQQLHSEMVDEFLHFDHIILIDAAVSGPAVAFYPLQKDASTHVSTSHHVNAGLLASLAHQLYKKELSIMICAVKGENFDIGEHLSATAKHHADIAINTIRNWIENGCR